MQFGWFPFRWVAVAPHTPTPTNSFEEVSFASLKTVRCRSLTFQNISRF